jgi:hypothetical protein
MASPGTAGHRARTPAGAAGKHDQKPERAGCFDTVIDCTVEADWDRSSAAAADTAVDWDRSSVAAADIAVDCNCSSVAEADTAVGRNNSWD